MLSTKAQLNGNLQNLFTEIDVHFMSFHVISRHFMETIQKQNEPHEWHNIFA